MEAGFSQSRTDWRVALHLFYPLLLLPVIGALLIFRGADSTEYAVFVRQFLIGLLCYFGCYWLIGRFRRELGDNRLIYLLLLPGIFHISLFVVDLMQAYGNGAFDIPDYLFYIKDIPRAGRKYLTIALTSLIVFALLGSACASKKMKASLLLLFPVAAFSFALLDTRAAQFAVGVAISATFLIPWLRKAFAAQATRIIYPRIFLVAYLAGVLIVSIAIGYSSGKYRWSQFNLSVISAIKGPHDANLDPGEDAWVHSSYWRNNSCVGRELRCSVDSSAYLRTSWLLFGLRGVLNHPFGLGANRKPLSALFLAENPSAGLDDIALKDSHSGLLDLAICFGLPGTICFLWFSLKILNLGRTRIKDNSDRVLLLGIYLIFIICLARFLVDSFTDGLGFYLMSTAGMLAAMSAPYNEPVDVVKSDSEFRIQKAA
ncbi:MAG: hypothetical protein JWQ21_3013 [Herminiimonas sp.]|nr:hypothetical protein [Herminiimonas sp.]